ncbi:LysR substrate binding domain-containing protein, partial [Paenibacillus sp. yr247]
RSLLEALKKGELDLALAHEWDDKYFPQLEDSNPPSGICAKSLYNDELVLAVAKGHPWRNIKRFLSGN